MNREKELFIEEENVVAGIFGAFLFSLAGGILWFVLYQFGYLAGISGFIGALAAIKGYSLFAKKESIKGIVISLVLAVLVMVIAWYLCFAKDLFEAYKEWFNNGEVDFVPSFLQCVTDGYVFLFDSEIAFSYLKDLAIGLLLCVIGSGGFVARTIKRIKAENTEETETVFEEENIEQEAPSSIEVE